MVALPGPVSLVRCLPVRGADSLDDHPSLRAPLNAFHVFSHLPSRVRPLSGNRLHLAACTGTWDSVLSPSSGRGGAPRHGLLPKEVAVGVTRSRAWVLIRGLFRRPREDEAPSQLVVVSGPISRPEAAVRPQSEPVEEG
jgi:hypothetical protein